MPLSVLKSRLLLMSQRRTQDSNSNERVFARCIMSPISMVYDEPSQSSSHTIPPKNMILLTSLPRPKKRLSLCPLEVLLKAMTYVLSNGWCKVAAAISLKMILISMSSQVWNVGQSKCALIPAIISVTRLPYVPLVVPVIFSDHCACRSMPSLPCAGL